MECVMDLSLEYMIEMLEIRTNCENCNVALPSESEEAMICTFECTFCVGCVEEILHNVCPNCGGGFEKRPVRPKIHLKKYPPSNKRIYKPIDVGNFNKVLEKYRDVSPPDR